MNYKIYQIVDNTNQDIYIGSTKKSLKNRLIEHKADFIRWKLGLMNYISCFKIFENNNYEIQLIEEGICENKKEKLEREKYFINTMNCINIVKNPIRTEEEKQKQQKEFRELHKEKLKNYDKDYYIENKDKIIKKSAEYYKKNKEYKNQSVECECGCIVNRVGLTRHRKTLKHIKSLKN